MKMLYENNFVGALPICDLPMSVWSTVLQIVKVAASIV